MRLFVDLRSVGAGRAVPRAPWGLPWRPLYCSASFSSIRSPSLFSSRSQPDSGGTSLQAYSDVFSSELFRTALWTTVWIAVVSTIGCLVLGFVLALIIAFVPFPGAKTVARFIDVYLSFPSFLITLALLFIYGTTGIVGSFQFLATPWGVLLAEVTYFTPFVMRPLLAAFSQLDTAQLEAASSLGARAPRIIRQVILPEALPALAAGGSLVLVLCLNEFGIVLFTGAKGVTTLPMLVYSKAILESDYPGACVVAVVNVLISVGLYGLYRVVSRRVGA